MDRITDEKRKIMRCSIVASDQEEPFAKVCKLLQLSGVRITKLNEKDNTIEGRIGTWLRPNFCKVFVRLYSSHPEMCLVETVLEGPRKGGELRILSAYVDMLGRNLEESLPVDVLDVVDRQVQVIKEDVQNKKHKMDYPNLFEI